MGTCRDWSMESGIDGKERNFVKREDSKGAIRMIGKILKRGMLLALTAICVCIGIYLGYEKYTDYMAVKENEGNTIVCFGDSIWDVSRDETGIAYLLGEKLNANVINMCISGTSAAKRGPEEENMDAICFVEVVDVITGGSGNGYLDEQNERIGLYGVDYSEVDLFLIAYGLNDYFCALERENADPYDVNTYAGALRYGIKKIQEAYPDAEIMILSSTYCQLYSYGKVKADSHELDYGGGTGRDYVSTAQKVAEELGVGFSDNYNTMYINRYNGPKYLRDGTHFTEKGREVYVGIVADSIIEQYKKNQKK